MRKLFLCLAFLCLLNTAASAAELSFGQERVYGALPEQAEELMGGTRNGSFAEGLNRIVEGVFPTLSSAVKEAMKSAAVMLCAVLLCSVAGGTDGLDPACIAGVVCIGAAGMLRMDALTAAGVEALGQMQAFADVLLPAMTAGTAAAGGVTASTAIYAGTALFTDFLMRLMGDMLLPAIYTYVAMRAAQALCGGELLSRLSKLIKSFFQGGIKLIVFLFTGYLTVTGLVAGSADATLVKTMKLSLSGVVPVVGSMIADASETVIVGAAAVRNAVGVFGMLAVIAICVGPFLCTLVQLLILKMAAAAAGAMGQPRLLNMMDAVCDAMGFLLSMLAAAALMLLISCVCYLKVRAA